MEVYKDIPDYEGFYQVSNLGNVRSLDRIIIRSNGIKTTIKKRILKPIIDKLGYSRVGLYKEKHEVKTVHSLVAITFLNHKPCKLKVVVDHIDNNPLNNNLENLQLISNRENSSKDRKNGTSKHIGVHWCESRNKWVSMIQIKGIKKNLGRYNCELAAAAAYKIALKNL